MEKIAVVGAGSFGTALATVARRAGQEVSLWALEPEVVDSVNGSHENTMFLKGIPLDPGIRATADVQECINGADAILLVPPAQHLRSVAKSLGTSVRAGVPLVICSKGIEQNSCALLSEVLEEELPDATIAVLSGPTFAHEVARGLPTAVTLASKDEYKASALAEALASHSFKAYLSQDVIGAQIGGAVKNVLAIGCGMTMGLGLGENARATRMTRGLAEMLRLARAKGALPETLMGLSGLGDLALTCNSLSSRNTSLGVALGEGKSLNEILSQRNAVTEGVPSALSVWTLAQRLDIEMPICEAMYRVLYEGIPAREAIEYLQTRPRRNELD